MANTITITAGLTWSDGKNTIKDSGSQSFSQSDGGNVIFNVQDIGTGAEAIVLGDVSPGYILFKNLDTPGTVQAPNNNFIIIGNDSGVALVAAKLSAGESVMIPTDQATWYAKADSAPVQMLVLAMDA